MKAVQILGFRSARTLSFLLPEVAEARQAGNPVILLVPEQYTLQAEWELVEGLSLPGLLDMDVLSPRRLTQLVREKAGRDPLRPLDDRGRSMALSRALILSRDQLGYYRGSVTLPGLPDKLSALIGDMQKAGLTPAGLRAQAERAVAAGTRLKEQDVALVWERYGELIQGRFADSFAQQQDTVRRLAASGVMDGAAVFVCGFDVLQPFECELLRASARVAASVTVAMCMAPEEAPDARIFLTQRLSALRLKDTLAEEGIPAEITFPAAPSTQDAPIAWLRDHLFRDAPQPFPGPAPAVQLHTAGNPYAEAEWAAQRLRSWHDHPAHRIPWGRMAIALAETAALPPALAQTLRAAGIPFYLARKDSAARHGLCRLLIGAVRAACNGTRQEDVLSVVKSGFSCLTEEEALRLENYAISNGIDRRGWHMPFTRGEEAAEMEPLRQRLMGPLSALHASLLGARNAAQSMEAVYRLLVDMGAYDSLLRREEALLARGMEAEAAQNRQVWRLTLDLIDQMHALLGGERAAMRDLARLLESGLREATLSSLPPQPDTVMVGEAGHLLPGRLDALILMGMQDGVTSSRLNSLISEEEREELTHSLGRSVGLRQAEQSALRMADFYRTITLPDRCLAFTWSASDLSGRSMHPAGLLSTLRETLPGLAVSGGATAESVQTPLSPQLALDSLACRLRACAEGREELPGALWQEALSRLWHSPRWHGAAEAMLQGLHAAAPLPALREGQGEMMAQDTVSVSRLERFAACPYSHFVRYALRPVERREFVFRADDRGSFFHEVLQRYTDAAATLPEWPALPDAQVEGLLDAAVAEATAGWAGGPLEADAMGRQLGREYIRTVRRAAWLFTRHARETAFSAARAEVRFGRGGSLPPLILDLADGRRVALEGVIDRVDDWHSGATVYRRLVDYKSSEQELDPVRMRHGLQLQLMLYMLAATTQVGVLPAGCFYFHVDDPQITTPEDIREEAEAQIARKLQIKGLVLAEAEVVEAMNGGEDGRVISKVFNKDGSVSANASAFTGPQMQRLMVYARRTAAALAERIREGCIDVSPAETKNRPACQYCDYAAICQRDPSLPGGQDRDYSMEDKGEAWQAMLEE